MADYVEQFFFKDGLANEANLLLTKDMHYVGKGDNIEFIEGNVRTLNSYSRNAGVSLTLGHNSAIIKSYYGDATIAEPGNYATNVSAALPILRLKKGSGFGRILERVVLPIKTGASAASLRIYSTLLDDNKNVMATVNSQLLTASTAQSISFQYDRSYGIFKNWYLCFGITGASLGEYWGSDGVQVYGRASLSAPDSNDVYSTQAFVASLSATVEVGSVGPIHLDFNHYNYVITDDSVINTSRFFNNVLFTIQGDNLSAARLEPWTGVEENYFVQKLPETYPYVMENIVINDRDELLLAGQYLHPHLVSGTYPSWNASPMTFTFKNSVIGTYTGATVYPRYMKEFKNRLHFFNVDIMQSLSSGVTTQEYRKSIFPSDGYAPYLFDWNSEISIDTKHDLIAGVVYKDYLFVFTEREIFYFTYDSNGNPTPVIRLTDDNGIANKEAVCVTDTAIYFANSSGAYKIEGLTITKISKVLEDDWVHDTEKICAVYDKKNNRILFSNIAYEAYVQIGGCGIFDIDSNTWGTQDIPIYDYISQDDNNKGSKLSYYLARLGGLFSVPNTRWALFVSLGGFNTNFAPELKDMYSATAYQNIMRIRKKCLISPRYDKKADAVYLHVQTKSVPFASQGYRVITFWDGQPSINVTQTDQYLAESDTSYIHEVNSHRFKVGGLGNVLNVNIERDPDTHGSKPIEFQNLQVTFNLIDRSF